MRETEEVRDKVVLVGLSSPVLKRAENADEETMEELSALVETAGGETVGIVLLLVKGLILSLPCISINQIPYVLSDSFKLLLQIINLVFKW